MSCKGWITWKRSYHCIICHYFARWRMSNSTICIKSSSYRSTRPVRRDTAYITPPILTLTSPSPRTSTDSRVITIHSTQTAQSWNSRTRSINTSRWWTSSRSSRTRRRSENIDTSCSSCESKSRIEVTQ